jgi:hypothetical protein
MKTAVAAIVHEEHDWKFQALYSRSEVICGLIDFRCSPLIINIDVRPRLVLFEQ